MHRMGPWTQLHGMGFEMNCLGTGTLPTHASGAGARRTMGFRGWECMGWWWVQLLLPLHGMGFELCCLRGGALPTRFVWAKCEGAKGMFADL